MLMKVATPAAILACAASSLTLPAFAQSGQATSSVSLYGLVDLYAGSLRRSNETARTTAVSSGGMNTTFWGVAGTEDLGGGLRTQFALESFFQADTGTNGRNATDPYFSKNAWVGFASGDWGVARLGRQTNPLFLATGASNPFGTSLALSPLMLHTWQPTYNRAVLGDSVWDKSAYYGSPEFAGLRVGIQHTFAGTEPNKRNTNVTVNYTRAALSAVVSAQRAEAGPGFTTAVDLQRVVMAGLSYDFGPVKGFASLQRARTPDIATTAKTAQLGALAPMGQGRLLASVVRTRRDADTGADTSRVTAALGYEHFLSKRTDLYAVALRDRLTGFSSQNSFAAGMRHRF